MNKYTYSRRSREVDSCAITALLATATLMACGVAAAADGDLDPTFGNGGFMVAGVTGANFLLPPKPAVQPDGKILYCSRIDTGGSTGADFLIVRFNADGSLDSTFNFDGRVTVDFDNNTDGCNAIAVQPNGKIVAVGASEPSGTFNYDFAIARLNADGTLDSTFGAGTGKTTVAFDLGDDNGDYGNAVALQADGKIVVAGWADTAAHGDDFAVTRLLPDGTRDSAFNVTGRVTIAFDLPGSATQTDEGDSVAIDGNGNIIVGGIAEAAPPNAQDFAVARLTPSGALDHDFDADGRATFAFDAGATNNDLSYDMIRQRDGKIVMVGSVDTGTGSTSNPDTAVVRLLPDGSPDADFGIGGKVLVPYDLVADGTDVAYGVLQDPAGRIVLAGGAATTTGARATVARLLGNGTLDASFGNFGKGVYDLDADAAAFTGIVLQGTQIIAAGEYIIGADQDDVVARVQVDLIFAGGFE